MKNGEESFDDSDNDAISEDGKKNEEDDEETNKIINAFEQVNMEDFMKEEDKENHDSMFSLGLARNSDISMNNSIWENLKNKITNIKNHFIFNFHLFGGENQLKINNKSKTFNINIFDEKYYDQEKLIKTLHNIPWFSYRKDFYPIKDKAKKKSCISDAGWGCMIRSSQMIFAQGIYKLFSMKDIQTFINEFISYFYDDKIPIKYLMKKSSKEYEEKKFDENGKDDYFDDFLILNEFKDSRISFIDISREMIKGLENLGERKKGEKNIISPYSVRNFIRMEEILNPNGKKIGQWFSNYEMIKLITRINEEMFKNNDNDFKVLNFHEGTIFLEDIINSCFQDEDEKENDIEGFENLTHEDIQSTIFALDGQHNKNLKSQIYIFNKKRYKFKHKFIIFVSVRHGLNKLEPEMYDEVLQIFSIKTNIGFIGGKSSRAYYFIGCCNNNLIFLDPHYVQSTIPLNNFGTDLLYKSYVPNDIYYMNIKDLTPSFTIGFAIKDMEGFKQCMEKLTDPNWYFIPQGINKSLENINKNYLFKVQNWHASNINQDISKFVKVDEEYFV